MQIEDIAFSKFEDLTKGLKEGIVCIGCGGDANEWVNGVTKILNDEDIAKGTPEELWSAVYRLIDKNSITHLAFIFSDKWKDFNVGKMAIWRIKFGSCSWISDYFTNYSKCFR